MKKILLLGSLILFLTSCAANKYEKEKEKCKDFYGYFTKSKKCLELKFESSNPKKYQENKELHGLILSALADQVYENKINNNEAWILYDDVIEGFNKAENKTNYLVTALEKYN